MPNNEQQKIHTAWELDRVLHAYVVYHYLVRFRTNLLTISDIDRECTVFFRNTMETVKANLAFLQDALLSHRDFFTESGRRSIQSISKTAS